MNVCVPRLQLCMLFNQAPSWKQAVILLADPEFKRKIAEMHPQRLQVGVRAHTCATARRVDDDRTG